MKRPATNAVRLLIACLVFAVATAHPDKFPLQIEVARSAFIDAQGRDFRIIGDAAWSLFVMLSPEESDIYLDVRANQGFNTILVNLIDRGLGGPENYAGVHPFSCGSGRQPNDRTHA